jgi:hypothetical protein
VFRLRGDPLKAAGKDCKRFSAVSCHFAVTLTRSHYFSYNFFNHALAR